MQKGCKVMYCVDFMNTAGPALVRRTSLTVDRSRHDSGVRTAAADGDSIRYPHIVGLNYRWGHSRCVAVMGGTQRDATGAGWGLQAHFRLVGSEFRRMGTEK